MGDRIVRVDGLPDFNTDDQTFKITAFDGWFDTPAPDVTMSPNGGSAGAIPSGPWLPVEQYLSLVGNIKVDASDLEFYRDQLLTSFPTNRDVPLRVITGDGGRQLWVRRYDKLTARISSRLDFSVPLVACDPYRYGLTPLGGALGVFIGETWYRRYGNTTVDDGGTYSDGYGEVYSDTYGGGFGGGGGGGSSTFPLSVRKYTNGKRTYQQAEPAGAFPDYLNLHSYGTATSRRVIVTLRGPLQAGKWWLYSEADTSRRIWGAVGLSADQTLTLDSRKMLATLQGGDVTDYIYGDWPVLAPGDNTFRLATSEPSDGYAVISAYEAFE